MTNKKNTKYFLGILWFILSLFISALNDVISKYLGKDLHSIEISFFRFLFSTLTLLPFMLFYGKKSFYTSRPLLHFTRGVLLFIGIFLWIYGLNKVPVTVVTVISFTVPLFVLILATYFLKEKVGIQRWIATLIGLTGIVVIINPNSSSFVPVAGLLVIAAITFAMLDVINKKYIISETMFSMLFYSSLVTTILAAFPMFYIWKTPNNQELLLLFLLGAGANLILYCLLKAFKLSEASALAPFRYIELIISTSLAFLVFGEIPSTTTIIGALIIIPSTLFVIHYEIKKNNNYAANINI